MTEFIRENADWLIPVIVAIVGGVISGIFYLLKKVGNHQKQVIKNVKNSNINQVMNK